MISSNRRIQKEYTDIIKDPPFKIDVNISNNNFSIWKVEFEGPKGIFSQSNNRYTI